MEQNTLVKKRLIIIAVAMVVSTVLLSQYLTANPEYILMNTVTSNNDYVGVDDSIGLNVIVEHYRDSKLLSTQEKENDIFLKNFGYYLYGTFQGLDSADGYLNEYDAGTSRQHAWQGYTASSLSRIHIGEGSTAPTLLDWGLETPVDLNYIMQCGYTVSGSQMNVTMAISFGITSTYTIREVGYSNWLDYGVGSDGFMMARDILGTPVSVISGDILTVKYVIMFN